LSILNLVVDLEFGCRSCIWLSILCARRNGKLASYNHVQNGGASYCSPCSLALSHLTLRDNRSVASGTSICALSSTKFELDDVAIKDHVYPVNCALYLNGGNAIAKISNCSFSVSSRTFHG